MEDVAAEASGESQHEHSSAELATMSARIAETFGRPSPPAEDDRKVLVDDILGIKDVKDRAALICQAMPHFEQPSEERSSLVDGAIATIQEADGIDIRIEPHPWHDAKAAIESAGSVSPVQKRLIDRLSVDNKWVGHRIDVTVDRSAHRNVSQEPEESSAISNPAPAPSGESSSLLTQGKRKREGELSELPSPKRHHLDEPEEGGSLAAELLRRLSPADRARAAKDLAPEMHGFSTHERSDLIHGAIDAIEDAEAEGMYHHDRDHPWHDFVSFAGQARPHLEPLHRTRIEGLVVGNKPRGHLIDLDGSPSSEAASSQAEEGSAAPQNLPPDSGLRRLSTSTRPDARTGDEQRGRRAQSFSPDASGNEQRVQRLERAPRRASSMQR